MTLKSAKAFSLLEVMITVGILSTAIVFIFRAFTAALSGAQLSQDISLACFLAEDKLWEITQRYQDGVMPPETSGQALLQERQFNWNYKTQEEEKLMKLEFTVTWQENAGREQSYMINTYLAPKK